MNKTLIQTARTFGVAFVLSGILCAWPFRVSATIVPITHVDNDMIGAVSKRTLRAFYSMRTQSWDDGNQLVVFVLSDDAELHSDFCSKVLGILPYHLRRNWDRLIFSGRASAPILVSSPAEMKRRVSQTPGSLGYLSIDDIDDSVSVLELKQ